MQGLDGATGLGISSLAVTIIGVADGCVQGSLFGIAGRMPSQYTQALMIGAACAGLVTSILRALTKVSDGVIHPHGNTYVGRLVVHCCGLWCC